MQTGSRISSPVIGQKKESGASCTVSASRCDEGETLLDNAGERLECELKNVENIVGVLCWFESVLLAMCVRMLCGHPCPPVVGPVPQSKGSLPQTRGAQLGVMVFFPSKINNQKKIKKKNARI